MRITILNQFYPPDISPTAQLAASLAEHRAICGDEVTVVASNGGYVVAASDDEHEGAAPGVRVFRVWTPQLGKRSKLNRLADYASFYLGAIWRLAVLPRQDLIVSMTTPPFIVAAALLHKLFHRNTRVVLWNMDCYPEIAERTGVIRERSFLARMLRRLNRRIFGSIDLLISLDFAMQELLLSSYSPGPGRPRSAIVPNWERASLFLPDVRPPPWAEAELLGVDSRFVILYSGNMGYGHGFETVLEAARTLSADPVVFLFVGGGSRWAELQAAVTRLGLRNIVMRTYVPKSMTKSIMASASCALITLQDFALGVMSPSKLHANLAMSLPVIYVGPEGSNVDEAVNRFDCGISIRNGSSGELVAWVRKSLASPARYRELRENARMAFEVAYCDTRVLSQFDALMLEVSTIRRH